MWLKIIKPILKLRNFIYLIFLGLILLLSGLTKYNKQYYMTLFDEKTKFTKAKHLIITAPTQKEGGLLRSQFCGNSNISFSNQVLR